MGKLEIALWVLIFALVGAVLYVWGLKKSINQKEDLSKKLLSASGARVIKYLKKNNTITKKEISSLIEGVTVGPVWSKGRLSVTDGKKVAEAVIDFLLKEMYIKEEEKNKYSLRK